MQPDDSDLRASPWQWRATEFAQHPGERALEVTRAANPSKPLALRYGFDVAGQVDEIGATASDAGGERRKVSTRLLKDDFGREVAVLSPDSGTVYKRYDEADQLTRVRDATGNLADMAYDAAGRMVARTVTSTAATSTQTAQGQTTTRYLYQGTQLIEIQHPQQTEHYTYDSGARLISKSVRLLLIDGEVSTSEERYRYDNNGRLVARSLADGSELQFERNGQGRIVGLSRQASAWAPFGWGRTTLVSGLEADLIGLRSATYGNGVIGQWQRSREGVLARVAYTSPLLAKSALRTAFENLMPQAHAAQAAKAPTATADSSSDQAPKQLPGAFGFERAQRAFWDGRLLYDMAGNVQVQGQFADTGAAQPAQTRYVYDGLDQLAQAVRIDAGQVDVRAAADREPPALSGTAWRYHTDSLGNRLLAQQQEPADEMGCTLRAGYADLVSDRLGAVPMDVAGRPLAEGERHCAWDAEGRLAAVSQPGLPASRYRYDARGLRLSKQVGADSTHYLYDERRQRVAELDAHGRIQREYVWLGSQLLAVIDLATPRAAGTAPADALGRLVQLVNIVWRHWTGHADTLSYVHANHLGASVAMTDSNARPVWSTEYAPFGRRVTAAAPLAVTVGDPKQATRAGGAGVQLDLRLPGQWEDAETGLYYNDHRYYDPQAGRYLNPDPSGLSGGLNAYAYAGNNPLGFADPLGLVLFAFDGTGNTDEEKWLKEHNSSQSNVLRFRTLYEDGTARYMAGVGTTQHDSTYGDINPADFKPWYVPLSAENADMGGNYSGPARIDRMIRYFNDEADLDADDDAAMEVDIVGFSRGAAQARDFANSIVSRTSNGYYSYKSGDGKQHCQKVDFRFMGLFDTVLSTNNSGHAYNLAIPDQFAYVAQAVALNEYRGDTSHAGMSSFGAFPLESIFSQAMARPTPEPGKTRIERGFIGSHADIGGGFGADENQLSQVALFWMVTQAQAAGVQMTDAPSSIVANPVIHDKSDSILTGKPGLKSEDRQVRYRDGTTTTQRNMAFSAGITYADTTQFINYLPANDPRRKSQSQTGTVDMKGYLQWLGNNGYGIGLKGQ